MSAATWPQDGLSNAYVVVVGPGTVVVLVCTEPATTTVFVDVTFTVDFGAVLITIVVGRGTERQLQAEDRAAPGE